VAQYGSVRIALPLRSKLLWCMCCINPSFSSNGLMKYV
jgi:hypothetical protein